MGAGQPDANQLNKLSQTNKSALNNQTNSLAQSDEAMRFLMSQPAVKKVSLNDAADGETLRQKTVADFYKEILLQQPLTKKSLSKKKLSVVLKTGKSPDGMTPADYERAKNRAIFKQAGYGMLTDEEIAMAVASIQSKGAVKNDNFGLENLRTEDAKPGAMFIDTNQATIEIAKRAGQAVLQYQANEAKRADRTKARSENEVNQMFADQTRVVWNSGVNLVEGTVNTVIDAALSQGGQNPIYNNLPEIAKPHVNLSGAKFDYRSEMMRRNLEGKVDGEGIKAGQFIETGLTVIAPLVVGKVFTPKVAPQSLKTLGGIPEVETTTAINTTAQTAQKIGRLEIEQGRQLSDVERKVADKLVAEGRNVKAPKEINQQGVKNPDFEVDGVKIELKTIENITSADISGAMSRRIYEAGKQAPNVIIDASNQAGTTKEIAKEAIIRTYALQNRTGNQRLQEVRIIGKDFDITVKYNPTK